MVDKTILQDQIKGYEASLKDLNNKKDLFNKAKGLNEEAEKLKQTCEKIKADLTAEKENQKSLVDQKNKALQETTKGMVAKMNAVLPAGSSVVEIRDDGSFFIGWNNGKKIVPYSGLSGGEKAAFDPALCKALGGTVLCIEAAEIDGAHLTDVLRKYEEAGIQCIVSSCHTPEAIPLAWMVVRL